MAASEIVPLIGEIIQTNLPLGLFILSTVITGNIVRIFLIENFNSIKWEIHFSDLIVLVSGITINFISIAFTGKKIIDFNPYLELAFWLKVAVTTCIFIFFTWNIRKYGRKWIKDTIQSFILAILGILFIILGLNSLPDIFNLESFKNCQQIYCKINLVIPKIFILLFISLLIYLGIKLILEASKNKRYKKSTSISLI